MADKNITLDLSLKDKSGSIKKRTAETKALNKELERSQKLATGTKSGSAAANMTESGYNKARGATGATGASGRDFANQAQGLGGLVRVYATYAANVFAVGAAFRALSKAAAVDNMISGMNQLGAASGVALGSMAKSFVEATGGAVSLQDAISATTKASSAGLSSKQFIELGKVAKNASQALGIDMQDAVSRLTRGITKLEPELLDELGLFTKIGPATDTYAKSIGKSASQLTDFERRQAFANAVLEEGKQKFGEIAAQVNPYDKLSASLQNLAQGGLSLLNTVLVPIIDVLSTSPAALTAGLALIGTTILKQALPALGQYRKELEESSKFSAAIAVQKGTEAESARAAIGKQALQKLEGVAEAKIEAVDNAVAKVAELEKNVGKNTQAHKILQKAIQDITSADLKHLDVIERKLRAEKNFAAADRYKEAIVAVNNSVQAENNYLVKEQQINAEIGKRLTLYQRLFTAQGRTIAAAERAQNIAARKGLVSGAANDTQVGGIAYAYQNLKQGIGDKGLTGFAAGFTKISGVATIATTALTGFIGALSTIGMFIGIAVAAFKLLDAALTTSAKEQSAYKDSVEKGEQTVATATATFKKYNDEINIQGILAKANALNEMNTSLKEQLARLNELEKKRGFWDRLFKLDTEPLSKNVTNAIEIAISDIDDKALQAQYQDKVNKILGNLSSGSAGTRNKAGFKKILSEALQSPITAEKAQDLLSLASTDSAKQALKELIDLQGTLNRLSNNAAEPLRNYSEALKTNVSMYQSLAKEAKLKGDAEVNAAVSTLDLIKETNLGLQDQQNAVATIKQLASSDDKTLSLMFGTGNTAYLKSLADTLKTANSVPTEVMNKVQSILSAATKDAVDKLERPFNNLATKIQGELSKTLLGFIGASDAKIDAMLAIDLQNLAIQKQDIEAKKRIVISQLEAADALKEAALLTKGREATDLVERKQAQEELSKFLAQKTEKTKNKYKAETGGFDLQIGQVLGQEQNLILKAKYDKKVLANNKAQEKQAKQDELSNLRDANYKYSPTYANMGAADRAASDATMAFNSTSRSFLLNTDKMIAQQNLNTEISKDPKADKSVKAAAAAANIELTKQLSIEAQIFTEKQKTYEFTKQQAVALAEVNTTHEKVKLAMQDEQLGQEILAASEERKLGYEQQVLQHKIDMGVITADQAQLEQSSLDKKVLAQQLIVKLASEEARYEAQRLDTALKISEALVKQAPQETITNLLELRRQEDLRHEATVQALYSENSLGQKVIDMNNEISVSQKAMRDRFIKGFEDMGDAIVDFALTGKASFGDLIKSMIADMLKLQMRQQMSQLGSVALNAITNAFAPGTGGGQSSAAFAAIDPRRLDSAKGNAFNSSLQKFAQGGAFTNSIVNSPTMFKFAKGAGLMGEAGPEAIMPLKRDASGNLGVRSSSGGKTDVIINNYSNSEATTKETTDSRGNKRIEVMIGEASAGEISKTGSAQQRSLGSTYGLKPSVIRR